MRADAWLNRGTRRGEFDMKLPARMALTPTGTDEVTSRRCYDHRAELR